jgi:isopentenyl-diphosphate delta-isomerase
LGDGLLHRAFTIFIFSDKKQLLLQRRSGYKLLWPLARESSCSSHPQPNEGYITAGQKRLEKELGFSCPLEMAERFHYKAKYKNNIGTENEVCALLTGNFNDTLTPNTKEVKALKWIDVNSLEIETHPNVDEFAPWLCYAMKYYKNNR